MKLYTQEQVIEMLNMHVEYNYTYPNADSILSDYTPIELPTDEEIDNHVEYDFLNSTEVHKYSEEAQLLMKAMCKSGALWMRDKIQGGEEAKERAANYMMLKGALDDSKEEPKQDLEKEMFDLEQELDIPSHLRWHNSKPKQETLEEVRKYAELSYYNGDEVNAFVGGAKWQADKMYSEEDLLSAFEAGMMFIGEDKGSFREWFEQFKKNKGGEQ